MLKPGESTINQILLRYKAGAKVRGFSWTLSRKRFKLLILSPCTYCGGGFINPSDGRGRYMPPKVTGVDRKNPRKGYTPENCVSCCGRCNRMKWSLSQKEFLEAVKQIGEYQCLQ